MNLFDQIRTSGGAMAAERLRAEIVAGNMANAETTRTAEGGPYRRKQVIFSSAQPTFGMVLAKAGGEPAIGGGVRVLDIVQDSRDPVLRYEPGHPDANAEGMVAYPNIDPIEETVDLMSALRSYQLNASAVQAAKQMIQQSLEILK
ncbi:flagellar basal-body rod protein FlgC [Candidatus Koribacter versatilis Ellin345]|uniref:Flagellar basal-body rod protein FlgC n=1 Tax=Koribacter versatilis (strain Ellin345) TaxID=204669 RepID=Q1IR44_KORVE|nr:flagellar basal body rod protein FlgC [Candidatus Koribacter versatilis]ABF40656.1 flagellar basal-body rod protein FlgC [Candidatus Koribacter versatilis Ellin345]